MEFGTSPAALAPLHQEKGLEAYEALGGLGALAKQLKTSLEHGIQSAEIPDRVQVFGENRIPSTPPKSFLSYLWDSTKDSTIRLLCVCAVTEAVNAIVDGSTHGMSMHTTQAIFEGASIIGTVFLVCGIQSTQDYLKDRSFRRLNADVNHVLVNVTRDGKLSQVVRYDLVVGDLVTIGVGDILEADGVLVAGEDVECDESALTGEPEDLKKDPANAPFLFSGTSVKNGSGAYLVTAVGTNTMSGRITALVRGQKVEAPKGGDASETAKEEDDAEAGKAGNKADGSEGTKGGKEKAKEKEEDGAEEGGKGSSVLQAKLDDMMGRIATFAFVAAIVASLARLIMFWSINYGAHGNKWRSDDITTMIQNIFTGIALVVVAVPEGLPLAVTLALSLSIKKMQQDNNLVKHLDATETMGSATTICSDKTGTLTQNRMTVMRAYIGGTEFAGEHSKEKSCGKVAGASPELHADVAQKLCLSICMNKGDGTDIAWDTAADRWEQKGNKTDCALLAFANDLGMDYREARKDPLYTSVDPTTGARTFGLKNYPFSSSRKRSGQAVPLPPGAGAACRIYVKGASEMILKLATQELRADGTVVPLTAADRDRIFSGTIEKFASHAMRTIGLAYRDFATMPSWDEELDPHEAVKLTGQTAKTFQPETGLTLLAVCGIHDPIRDGVPRAIMQCNRAGVDVRMVTGDHKATAVAIAKECGILRRGIDYKDAPGEPLAHKFTAMTGEEFRAHVLDAKNRIDQARFDEVWPYLRVLARSSPEDKHTLVTGLCDSTLCETPEGKKLPIHQDRQIVAVTGDGTNDAPALRKAHVGFAMKITGTRVAQDAADILLLDDNFASVVKACLWGRNVYDSIAKFLQFQLTVNISAVLITLIGVFSFNTQPLSVVQMIWVNLIMDSLGALTFASETPTERLLERAPYGRNRALLSFQMKCNMIGQAAYQLVVMLVILFASAGPNCGLLAQPCYTFPRGGFLNLQSGLGREGASEHLTFLFNAFVFMQLFNWINSRKLSFEWNVFENLHTCHTFITVWLIVLGVQVIIVAAAGSPGNQTVIGLIFQTVALSGPEWGICIGVGAFSICWQWVVIAVGRALLPAKWADTREQSAAGHASSKAPTVVVIDTAASPEETKVNTWMASGNAGR